MTAALLSALLFLSPAHAASFAKVPSQTGNFCRDQALAHLRHLFGAGIRFGKTFTALAGDDVSMWIKTDACDGYFVAHLNRNASCTSAHYGFAPTYIRRIWAYGDCAALLPRDTYPRKDSLR